MSCPYCGGIITCECNESKEEYEFQEWLNSSDYFELTRGR